MKSKISRLLSLVLVVPLITSIRAQAEEAFLFLQEEAEVTSASRIPETQRKAAATTYIVTSADIHAMGAQSIPDALRHVPGVDIMQTRTDQAEVTIRGLASVVNSRTLVLLDGKSVLNSVYDFVTWNSIPVIMDEIDRIEIVEGPASAVYGGNAVDGVINIITKTPEQLQGGVVRYTAGERQLQRTSAVYGRQNGDFGLRVGGDWNTMNRYEDSSQLASQSGKFDTLLNYRLSGVSEISVSGGVSDMNTQRTVGATGTAFDEGITSFSRADYTYAGTRVRVNWNHGRTHFSEYQFPPNTNADYDTYAAEVTQSLSLPFQNVAVLGSSYRLDTARSLVLEPAQVSQDLWSAFLEDKWTLSPKWSVLASVRMDRHHLTPILFSPRGSVVYNPVHEHVFRLSAGSAFRNPTLTENYLDNTIVLPNSGSTVPNPPYTHIETLSLGNRALQPERMTTVEAAHQGRFGALKSTLAMFHYQLANTIQASNSTVTSAAPPTLQTLTSFTNDSGTLKAWGGEAGVEWMTTAWLTSFANYSYQYLHDDSATQKIPNESPRHKANGGFKLNSGPWSGALWSNWVDKTVWPAVLQQQAGADDVAVVNSYCLVNLHLGYAFRGRWMGLEVGVTGSNILNHDHYEALPADGATRPGQNGEIIRSRWSGTVTYRF